MGPIPRQSNSATTRSIHTAKLYFLDDEKGIVPPARFELEYWDGKAWQPIPNQTRSPEKPSGRRSKCSSFPGHRNGRKSGSVAPRE